MIINLLVLFYYKRDNPNDYKYDEATNPIRIASWVSIVFALLFMLFWFIVKYNTIRKIRWD